MADLVCMLAGIMQPMDMENTGSIFLWAVPLIVCIATVYKATKFNEVTNFRFVKESLVLSGTILGFMLLIAIVLWVFVAIFT